MSHPITAIKEFRSDGRCYLSVMDNGNELTRINYDNGQFILTARNSDIETTPSGLLNLHEEVAHWGQDIFNRHHPADRGTFPVCDYKIEKKNNGDYKLMGDIGDLQMRATYDSGSGDIYQGQLVIKSRPAATVSIHGFLLFLSIYRQFLRLCYHDTQIY